MDKLEVFNQHRPLLFSIAYNMLSSAMDAEDMVQEVYLRWAGSPDVESPRAYLSAIRRTCASMLFNPRKLSVSSTLAPGCLSRLLPNPAIRSRRRC